MQEFVSVSGLKYKDEPDLDIDNWRDDKRFLSAEEKRKYMLKTIRKEHSKACNTWLICSNYPQEKFSQIRN